MELQEELDLKYLKLHMTHQFHYQKYSKFPNSRTHYHDSPVPPRSEKKTGTGQKRSAQLEREPDRNWNVSSDGNTNDHVGESTSERAH